MTVRANTRRSTEAHTSHVPASVAHARADEWVDPESMERCETCGLGWTVDPFHFDCPSNDPETWGPLPTEVIAAELVACTLGQRWHADRLELRTDTAGRVMHAASRMRANLAWLQERLAR